MSAFNSRHPSVRAALKLSALGTVSALALVAAAPQAAFAQAQTSQAAQNAQAPQVEEIVVTGSRLIRNGYEAPTPLTVVTAEALQDQTASSNLADTLNTLPAFANPTTPASAVAGI